MNCEPCEHAKNHGWWGPSVKGGTHCRGCHRTWTAYGEMHCAACHRHFSTLMAFDAHQRRDVCADPPAIGPKGGKGFVLLNRASGPTWGQEMDEKRLESLRQHRKTVSTGASK